MIQHNIRIILSILQSCLHFFKARDVNRCPPENKNKFPWKLEKINFKVQRNCENTGKLLLSVSFHQ